MINHKRQISIATKDISDVECPLVRDSRNSTAYTTAIQSILRQSRGDLIFNLRKALRHELGEIPMEFAFRNSINNAVNRAIESVLETVAIGI
jgi:hypothetical protein